MREWAAVDVHGRTIVRGLVGWHAGWLWHADAGVAVACRCQRSGDSNRQLHAAEEKELLQQQQKRVACLVAIWVGQYDHLHRGLARSVQAHQRRQHCEAAALHLLLHIVVVGSGAQCKASSKCQHQCKTAQRTAIDSTALRAGHVALALLSLDTDL